jgi:hypothetical protein
MCLDHPRIQPAITHFDRYSIAQSHLMHAAQALTSGPYAYHRVPSTEHLTGVKALQERDSYIQRRTLQAHPVSDRGRQTLMAIIQPLSRLGDQAPWVECAPQVLVMSQLTPQPRNTPGDARLQHEGRAVYPRA